MKQICNNCKLLTDGGICTITAHSSKSKIEEYAVSGIEYIEVLKVDKLLLRPDIFKQIARWF